MRRCLLLGSVAVIGVAHLALAAAGDGKGKTDLPAGLPGQGGPSVPAPVPGQNGREAVRPGGGKPEPRPIELSGRLRRPVKWYPQLELVPAGQIQRFDLRGELLRDLKEGTPIRVRGVVRSALHRGGTKENPSPFPAQWTIWLEVTNVQVMQDPLEDLKGLRDGS